MTEEVLDMYNGDTLIPVRSSPLKQSERPSKIAHIAPKIRTPVLLRMICWGFSEDAADAERGHTQSAATRFKNVKTNIHTKICNMMQHVCKWPENARGQAQPSKIEKHYPVNVWWVQFPGFSRYTHDTLWEVWRKCVLVVFRMLNLPEFQDFLTPF